MTRWMACTATAIAVAAVSLPDAAAGRSSPEPAKRSEAELLRLETELLGHAHAAEHAAQRRLARGARKRRRAWERAGAGRAANDRTTRRALLATGPPSEIGRWQPGTTMPGVAINAALLPTGKILYYPGRGYSYVGAERAYIWDRTRPVVSGSNPRLLSPPTPSAWTIFCGGTSFLANGDVFMSGGQSARAVERGAPIVMTFNPFSETWTRRADMPDGRWYPGQHLLTSGLTVILDGKGTSGSSNRLIEVYDPATAKTRTIATRATAGAPPDGGGYPHMTTLPSGRTLVSGPEPADSWLFTTNGSSISWTDVPNLATKRDFASGVLMPGPPAGSTKVMVIAGRHFGDVTQNSTVIFDEANASAGWRPGPSLNVGRAHHNTVLLPGGSMATIGGGFGIRSGNLYAADATHKQVELYDPATNSWKLGPSQVQRRAYHSIALLLPDGTVLSAGDDGPGDGGGNQNDLFEIYEPPYLHKTTASGAPVPRPTITNAPGTIAYGQAFTVSSPDSNVTRAVLVALGATTHANDMNQRHVELGLTKRTDGSGYDLAAPSRAALAPAGYYMLFLLNDKGVPSIAKFVRLAAGTAPVTTLAPTVTPTPATTTAPAPTVTAAGAPAIGTATAGDRSATVRWSAPSSDGGAAITGYRVRTFAGTAQVGATTEVADGAATSTVISGLTNGTRYTFDVAAVNAAGAGAFSTRSAPVTPTAGTTPPSTRTLTLTAVADTMAKQATATSAFGAASPLGVTGEDVAGNASSRVTSYLKFTVPTLAAGESIADATLSLFVTGTTADGPEVFPTATDWTEPGLTWDARPARSASTPVGDFASMSSGDARAGTAVTGVTAAGDVSLELSADGTDGLEFAAREDATAANAPQLVLTIRSG